MGNLVIRRLDAFMAIPRWGDLRGIVLLPALLLPLGETFAQDDRAASPGRIAFSSDRAGRYDIYVINPDGTGLTSLTEHTGDDTSPAWSPDGGRLAFVSDRAGQPAIYVMRDDGSEVRRVSTGTLDARDPVWLPDGEHLAYTVTKANRDLEIQVMNLATGEVTVLVVGWSPSWSPDGSRMAFTGGQMPQIVIANHDGGNARTVFELDVNNMTFDMGPLWSPDGTQILFTGIVMDPENPEMNHEVFLTDVAGKERLRLTDQPGADQANDWSPDGREIVFLSERDGNLELYVLTIADGAIRRLTNHPGNDNWASWGSIPGSVEYSPLRPVPDSSVVNSGRDPVPWLFTNELNNKFAGMWSNIDPAARILTQIEIFQADTGLQFQAWAGDRQWPELPLHLVGASVEDNSFEYAFASRELGFETIYLIMRIDGDQLVVETYIIFNDNSGRSNLRTVQLLRRIARVRITPRTITLVSLGETVQLTASAHDVNWSTVSGGTFTWSSSDPSIATVSSSGLVTAVANGGATITATTNGVSGTAMVVVDQAGNKGRAFNMR